MKFSQITYNRPDMNALTELTAATLKTLSEAASAQEQLDALKSFQKSFQTVDTMSTVVSIRHTINTKDAFFDQEKAYFDEITPQIEELGQQVNLALLNSLYRTELENELGSLLFDNLKIAVRSFKPEMVELMQEENKLVTQYENLYASAMVDFDGQTMPLPKLGSYKESTDRSVRKAAYEADGKFFDRHQAELDEIFDQLVKNRAAQAKLLGHKNYLQLGYDRLGRNCYGPNDVSIFREQIAQDMVPLAARVKEDQRRRLGVEHLRFYDDGILFPDGNAKPQGTSDDILKAGLDMYHSLSPETAEFIDFMYENELLDVLSRNGKAPGGYCTSLPDYKAPFIFSNFNGTSGDVDVLTHEAGHAFADYRAFKKDYMRELHAPTLEACECHSMSMEFLTHDFHKNFFGAETQRYEIAHCEYGLIFIPYGCMVDEFQHRIYEDPELTPAQRNALWLKLEKKYRPWIDFANLPFYSRGAGWQRQLHIYMDPLYYIDYCMAQIVAYQFWIASMTNPVDAWNRYLSFVDQGGTMTFEELVQFAGLKVPYEPGFIKEIGETISKWLDANPLSQSLS